MQSKFYKIDLVHLIQLSECGRYGISSNMGTPSREIFNSIKKFKRGWKLTFIMTYVKQNIF